MFQARQRTTVTTLVVLAGLVIGSACQAQSSIQAAQTAIVAGQTALPGAQATAQAGATLVSSALSNAQPLAGTLQALLQGASVTVHTTPDGAAPDAATQVDITAVDAQGTLAQVSPTVRNAAVAAGLQSAAQYYPKATITLVVNDASGGTVVRGSVRPGQTPSIQ